MKESAPPTETARGPEVTPSPQHWGGPGTHVFPEQWPKGILGLVQGDCRVTRRNRDWDRSEGSGNPAGFSRRRLSGLAEGVTEEGDSCAPAHLPAVCVGEHLTPLQQVLTAGRCPRGASGVDRSLADVLLSPLTCRSHCPGSPLLVTQILSAPAVGTP